MMSDEEGVGSGGSEEGGDQERARLNETEGAESGKATKARTSFVGAKKRYEDDQGEKERLSFAHCTLHRRALTCY